VISNRDILRSFVSSRTSWIVLAEDYSIEWQFFRHEAILGHIPAIIPNPNLKLFRRSALKTWVAAILQEHSTQQIIRR